MTTPFRNDVDALTSRLAYIEAELAALEAKSREYARLREDLAELQAERADLKRRLEARAVRRGGALLDTVRVASPCHESWADMVGDERTRFCKKCEKNVHDISAMPRVEAEAFLESVAGSACIRMYRRGDGTVLTTDCPVGARRKRVKRLVLSVVGAGLATASVVAFWRTEHPMTMGEAEVGKMEAIPTMGTAAPIVSVAPPPSANPAPSASAR